MKLTLDFAATQDEQADLWEVLRSLVPMLAQVDRFWLEPQGARCMVLGENVEIDLGLSVDEGALVIEFEHARQKAVFTTKLPEAAWLWKVAALVKSAALVAPASVSMVLIGRELRVRVQGVQFTHCLVSEDRLIVKMTHA